MSVRRAAALALSAALGITGLTAAAPSATAAPGAPYDVTVPAPADPAGTSGMVLTSVGTGVQMMRGGESAYPVWQSLQDGRVAHGPGCETDDWFHRGDRVVCVSSQGDEATVHDFASGADFTRPLGFEKWYPVVGADRLLAADSGADGVVLHLLGYGSDAPADLDVPLPGDQLPSVLGHDDTGALITYGDRTALVDFATGTLTPVPAMPFAAPSPEAVLSADWIVRYEESGAGQAFVVSRTDPGDPGRTVKLPAADDAQGRIGVLGDWIVGQYSDPYSSETTPTLATPIDGGETRDLGVPAYGGVTAGADGALYTQGGTDPAHWGVRRIAPGSDGVPVTSQVLALPPTLPYTSLTMAGGRVVTETQTDTHTLRGFDVSLSGTGGAAQRWTCDALKALGPNCPSVLAADGTSEGTWWRDTGDGRLVSLENGGRPASAGQPACSDCAVTARVTTPGSAGTTRKVVLAQPGTLQVNNVYEVSGRYVRFRGTTAAGRRSLVADVETGKILRDTAVVGQALQGGRLWTASATDGAVSAVDLRTGATVETHDLGTKCVISTLEAAGRWLLARCGGSQSVTMYDREKKASTTFTVGSTAEARLGDGFVVSSSYGSMGHSLWVADFRSGARVDRSYDPLASADVYDPTATWAVDRFGGGFAYIDSWRAVHVVGVGGATSRLTALDSDVPAANLKSAPWKPRWWLSKPAASWTLTLRHKATGRTVRTLTGGEARGIVAPSWDGKDTAGRFVANGAYTWALSVKAADGHGADLAVSGAVSVTGGAPVWRDLAGDDGFGDLLVTDTAGLVSMYRGTGTGALSARIAGTGTAFPTTAVLVPVGDLNGDRCADVYAKVGDQLRAYRPGCGKVVSAASPYTVVGSGWAQYDVLTSPGDVNGDGFADLVARQASTGDVYVVGGTADHRLKARVRIGTNWKLYKKLFGAGDLNGDGRGDLLGVDASGVLWRYSSTATGGVTARLKVGPGWGGYSSLVAVGDLSGDGRADLVARDTAGKLWRYSGTGTGAYGARAAIGSGWGGFKALF
ncbi:FG-GAP-like repeat-containing protein [Streptomyces sp. NPDC057494]|uniref:FG-GAP-like repeat-containing protein n=1 Tax=Streptomyces sp. NPDC057494 TaxID=3346148 RepID=UPI0036C7A52B